MAKRAAQKTNPRVRLDQKFFLKDEDLNDSAFFEASPLSSTTPHKTPMSHGSIKHMIDMAELAERIEKQERRDRRAITRAYAKAMYCKQEIFPDNINYTEQRAGWSSISDII